MPATTAQSLPLLRVCEENGCLTVFDHTTLPFAVQRVFTVQASAGALRGQHAHRFGTQALVALVGRVTVRLTNARGTSETILVAGGPGMIIPPMVWSEQEYLDAENTLLVLCDTPFTEADYIRDLDEFRFLM
ncbi:MAG: FdtA/QdtA family cupin domain-containing protein [Candidatus Nanopelagicales bacterium]|nr:FdtA/QdtA family cupin domain-containing protein [Candidatus Nanopelagicales bacterium]